MRWLNVSVAEALQTLEGTENQKTVTKIQVKKEGNYAIF
jgi:hypothetical protein